MTFYPTDDPGLATNAGFPVCLFLGTKALPNRVSLVSISNRGLLLKAKGTLLLHLISYVALGKYKEIKTTLSCDEKGTRHL